MMTQRILLALAAAVSLLAANPATTWGQSGSGEAVAPTARPQEVDERVSEPAIAPLPPTPPAIEARPTLHPSAIPPTSLISEDAVTLGAKETVDTLAVQNRPLILEGRVNHDVFAFNSEVTVKSGAQIGGHLHVIGGSVTNQAGDQARIVLHEPEDWQITGSFRAASPQAAASPERPKEKKDWFGGQLALLLMGLVGGLILLIVAPRATHQTTTMVELEPARCLGVGGICAVAGLILVALNAALMNSPVKLLYAPFGLVIASVPLLLLACGWLCGMRYVGNLVARKFGQNQNGNLYARMAMGLGAFFLLNVLLGSLNSSLGTVGLAVEFGIALMGVGAILLTGFGKDPDWLGARLRGQRPWFSR